MPAPLLRGLRVLLGALLLVPLSLLTAAAAEPEGVGLDVVSRTELPAPSPEPRPEQLSLTADGDLLVVLGWLGLGVVQADPRTGEVRQETDPVRGDLLEADAVAEEGDRLLLVTWTQEGDTPFRYGIAVVGTGSRVVEEFRRIPAVPEGLPATRAAFSPDGATLYVLHERPGSVPELLAVDPATGAVRAATPVEPGVTGDFLPDEIAVSPDGSTVVAAVSSGGTTVLVRVGADLAPLGPPVALPSAWDAPGTGGVAVADDGTVYATARDTRAEYSTALVTVAPGAADARPLASLRGGVNDLAVADGTLWVVGAEVQLSRYDAATGVLEGAQALCDDPFDNEGGNVLAGADGTVWLTGVCEDEDAYLWVLARP
ncbi:hypothetical protein ACI8AF_16910 [Blastococcus sp. SYSU D00669]